MSHEHHTEEEAEAFVEAYIDATMIKAFMAVEREKNGQGCGCLNCLKAAARYANECIDMVAGEHAGQFMHYAVSNKHIIELQPGEEPPELPKYWGA
jgi:hypothetical protein